MKKKYLFLVGVFVFTIISCGGGDDLQEPEVDNTAPTTPTLIYPLNNTVCIDHNIIFEWGASTDTEGNRITYSLEIAENNSFSPILQTETTFGQSKLISLTSGKAYYWRIKAVDSRAAESEYSSISQFLTEGDGDSNHLPFAPNLISPALNYEITGTSTTLSWSASDVDEDTLSYDVYLDTNAVPVTLVSENQSATTFLAEGLSPASTYYFKVVAKDGNGGVSVGQTWSFTTR
ncbi:fibronectin type III domain-containing protein [uncultured Polaribacter sp.]|uniref:fibronectin type III domain-containing protein n=1 Tax=uncultured Polaribacter sp. TaxID=174711 RepID=UPI00261EBED2|nr:fibronectin type III domain-containing protein [uncultured Polaribacter sp.]